MLKPFGEMEDSEDTLTNWKDLGFGVFGFCSGVKRVSRNEFNRFCVNNLSCFELYSD